LHPKAYCIVVDLDFYIIERIYFRTACNMKNEEPKIEFIYATLLQFFSMALYFEFSCSLYVIKKYKKKLEEQT